MEDFLFEDEKIKIYNYLIYAGDSFQYVCLNRQELRIGH